MNLDRFNALTERIQALSIKERVGVILAISAVVYALWDFLLMQPMLTEEKKLSADLLQKNEQVVQVSEQINKLSNSGLDLKDKKNRQRLESLLQQLKTTDQRLLEITSNLIPPELMANVLETMLRKSAGLRIRSLQGLGATPFPEEPVAKEIRKNESKDTRQTKIVGKDEPGKMSSGQAWRHGLRVEFSGSYLDTVKYLQSLEDLNWQFYWDSVELDADDYPDVNTAIRIYTLSLDKEWLGV